MTNGSVELAKAAPEPTRADNLVPIEDGGDIVAALNPASAGKTLRLRIDGRAFLEIDGRQGVAG